MANCTSIDSLVTPYVDDDLGAADRLKVDEHVRRCASCYARLAAERAVRDLIGMRRGQLAREQASPALRERCARLAPGRAATPSGRVNVLLATLRRHSGSLALAATIVVIVGGAVVYQTGASSRLLAAELTADHVKCFGIVNPVLHTHDDAADVEASMASRFEWPVRLPAAPAGAGLELVGARPCLYGKGLVAHIMYRHDGQPVSVFMLPRTTRGEEMIDVLGHRASMWSSGNRTFVIIAREPRDQMARLTSYIQTAFR